MYNLYSLLHILLYTKILKEKQKTNIILTSIDKYSTLHLLLYIFNIKLI